tara:strand:+ start:486 stop:725 length:240 start_codon:yes stop_codon:yes gene_type:complete
MNKSPFYKTGWVQKVTESPKFDKGGLHKALNVPEGKDIPCSKLRSAWKNRATNGLTGKLTFAFNTGSKSCAPAGWGDKK